MAQRCNLLDPDEYERRRAGRLCYACGKAGHCSFEHAADGSPPAGNKVSPIPTGATDKEGTRGGRGLEGRRTKKEVTGRQRRQTNYLYLLYKAVYSLSDSLFPLVLTGQGRPREKAVGRNRCLRKVPGRSRCNKVPRCKTKKVLNVTRIAPQCKTKKALTVVRKFPQCKTKEVLTVTRNAPLCKTKKVLTVM
jgi:hypothetical protein